MLNYPYNLRISLYSNKKYSTHIDKNKIDKAWEYITLYEKDVFVIIYNQNISLVVVLRFCF